MKTKILKNPTIILLAILFKTTILFSQSGSTSPRHANILIKTRTDRDSVVLRWGINTPGGWFTANKLGYIVEKVKIDTGGNFNPGSYHRLNIEPLMPWSLEIWKQKAGRNNRYAAIAAQTLYGKSFIPKSMQNGNNGSLINSANELLNRYGFAMFAADNDALTAEGLGLRITDKNVKEGETYIYRVYTAQQDPSYSIDTAYAVVKVLPFEESPAPFDLKSEPGDGFVKLKWKDIKGVSYSGYYVYKSQGGINFKKLNDIPLVSANTKEGEKFRNYTFIDTLVENYHKYFYKVRGVTPFAELSKPALITGMGKDLTPPHLPIVNKPLQINMHAIKLTWKYPDNISDLKGFLIAKSSNPDRSFYPLNKEPLSKGIREFIDDSASSNEPYYIIGAVDTAGNIARSFPAFAILIDSLPPSKPIGLKGSIDLNGVVNLHWKLGPEEDIIGYRVLWANSPEHEFTVKPGSLVKDTSFVDSININTLTRYVYYKITAVDNRYNESVPSEILVLKRPDKIPPASPAFKNVFVTSNNVKLIWAISPSPDVKYQRLLRNENGKSWAEVDSLNNKTNNYLDTSVIRNHVYNYKIETADSDGNKSLSSIVAARPYDNGSRPSPSITSVRFDSTQNKIFLTWQYKPPKRERFYFVIYRATGSNTLSGYKALKSSENSFYDDELFGKGTYKYSVKVKTYNGAESPLSRAVKIAVK